MLTLVSRNVDILQHEYFTNIRYRMSNPGVDRAKIVVDRRADARGTEDVSSASLCWRLLSGVAGSDAVLVGFTSCDSKPQRT
jgi:hypothetical protein